MKTIQKFTLLTFVIVLSAACTEVSNDINIDDIQERAQSKIAKLNEAIANDSTCIDTRLARAAALQEMTEGSSVFLKINDLVTLSETPRIIYAYDSKPKYYEFDIIEKGKIIGVITTFAQKEAPACIAFIFNEPLNRKIHDGLEMFEGFYPSVHWGIPNEIGVPPSVLYDTDGITPITKIPSINEYERYDELFEGIEKSSGIRENITYNEENKASQTELSYNYWRNIQRKIQQRGKISNVIMKVQNNDMGYDKWPAMPYVIPMYDNEKLMKTHWSGECGPCAISWVYRGLYSHYPCTSTSPDSYISIYGDLNKYATLNGEKKIVFVSRYYLDDKFYDRAIYDYNNIGNDEKFNIYKEKANNASRQVDNGLYEASLKRTVKTGEKYPMYQLGINNAIKEITNNKYKITTTTQTKKHIKENNLPVFIMYGISGTFHYVVAFGVGGVASKDYILITDNGSMTCDFGYFPYWRYEGANYGIRYKMVLK